VREKILRFLSAPFVAKCIIRHTLPQFHSNSGAISSRPEPTASPETGSIATVPTPSPLSPPNRRPEANYAAHAPSPPPIAAQTTADRPLPRPDAHPEFQTRRCLTRRPRSPPPHAQHSRQPCRHPPRPLPSPPHTTFERAAIGFSSSRSETAAAPKQSRPALACHRSYPPHAGSTIHTVESPATAHPDTHPPAPDPSPDPSRNIPPQPRQSPHPRHRRSAPPETPIPRPSPGATPVRPRPHPPAPLSGIPPASSPPLPQPPNAAKNPPTQESELLIQKTAHSVSFDSKSPLASVRPVGPPRWSAQRSHDTNRPASLRSSLRQDPRLTLPNRCERFPSPSADLIRYCCNRFCWQGF